MLRMKKKEVPKGSSPADLGFDPDNPDWDKLTKTFGSGMDLGEATDKELEAEMRAMGWKEDGDSPPPESHAFDPSQFANLGLVDDENIQLTEADMNDPELLGELGNFGVTEDDFESDGEAADGPADVHGDEYSHEGGLEDEEELEPSSPPPMPAQSGLQSYSYSSGRSTDDQDTYLMEAAVTAQKQRALALKKAGDSAKAVEAMREAKRLEAELAAQRKLNVAATVAAPPERVIATSVAPPERANAARAPPALPARQQQQAPARPKRETSNGAVSGGSGAAAATAGGKSGANASSAVAAAAAAADPADVVAQLQETAREYKRMALSFKKEGRNAEALAQLKRALAIEDKLRAHAAANGGVAASDTPPSLRRGRSSNSSLDSDALGTSGTIRRNSSVSEAAAASADAASASDATQLLSRLAPAGRPPLQQQQVGGGQQRGSGGPDQFSQLEEALKVAARAHLERAKALVGTDRGAAAAEKKKVEACTANLAKLREVRTIPGAVPPPFHWEMTRKNRLKVIREIGMEEIELTLGKVDGLSSKLGKHKQSTIFVNYDLGYSKDDAKVSKGYSKEVVAADNEADIAHTAKYPLKRSKGTQLAFTHRKASFEIVRKKALWGQEAVAKVIVPLAPLLTACELQCNAPLLSDARREIGGTMEVHLRLCKPIQSDEVVVVEEKELIVGPWPTVFHSSGAPDHAMAAAIAAANAAAAAAQAPLAPAATAAAAASANAAGGSSSSSAGMRSPTSAAATTAQGGQRLASPGTSAASATTAAAAAAAAGTAVPAGRRSPTVAAGAAGAASSAVVGGVELTQDEMEDPMAPEHIDSNNVLEAEIAAMGNPTSSEQLIRKAKLEHKLRCLVYVVQNEELSLDQYLAMLRTRSERDRALALWLKKEGRLREAGAVAMRIKMMREELESAPDDDEGA